ncbi:hypothetical protein GW777_05760 [Candidatus Peregrinibacteria bacterium]|nr:hypothetical protein [bacterium]NCQ55793.1 hypothetical protein [Candidatus Parcubacteria bacterium]NCS67860.1 hypothetical protein [Candidatus Peregrinibacteria bacterium]
MKKIIFLFGLSLLTISPSFAASLQIQTVYQHSRTLPKNAVRVPFVQADLTAIDGAIEVNGLTILRTGLSSNEDLGRIWAETSDFQRTNSRQLTNDDTTELTFRSPLILAEGETERITVYANLEFEGRGRNLALNIVEIDHTTSTVVAPVVVTTPVQEKQIPVITKSQSRYDRQNFRIQCMNQKCSLVPRN